MDYMVQTINSPKSKIVLVNIKIDNAGLERNADIICDEELIETEL